MLPWEIWKPTKSAKANSTNTIFLFSLMQVHFSQMYYFRFFFYNSAIFKGLLCYFKNSPHLEKMLETHNENALETMLSWAEGWQITSCQEKNQRHWLGKENVIDRTETVQLQLGKKWGSSNHKYLEPLFPQQRSYYQKWR